MLLRSEGQIVPGKAAIIRGTIILEVLLTIRVVVSTTIKLGSSSFNGYKTTWYSDFFKFSIQVKSKPLSRYWSIAYESIDRRKLRCKLGTSLWISIKPTHQLVDIIKLPRKKMILTHNCHIKMAIFRMPTFKNNTFLSLETARVFSAGALRTGIAQSDWEHFVWNERYFQNISE